MNKKSIEEFVLKVEEISKIGLKYSSDPYAIDNYTQLQDLAKNFLLDQMDVKLNSDNFFVRDIYPTPNVSVRTVIFNDTRDKVLLVRERSDGGFSLPGGWSELCLSPSESALKEVWEETGSRCQLVRLVGVFDRWHDCKKSGLPEYIIVFEGKIISDDREPCFEILEKGYYSLECLPTWSIKNNPEQMKKIIEAAKMEKTLFD